MLAPTYLYKFFETVRSFLLIILLCLCTNFVHSQCYTLADSIITFQYTKTNFDNNYIDIFILTDYNNTILDSTTTNSFVGRESGVYRIYAMNVLNDGSFNLNDFTTIQDINGICVNVNPNYLEIIICPNVNDCDSFDGTYSFDATGGNQSFNTVYVLTDLSKNILKISATSSFVNIQMGEYLIFPINFDILDNLEIGVNIESLIGNCFHIGLPLLIKRCDPCYVTLGDDFVICQSQSVVLTATGTLGGIFIWSTGQTTSAINVIPLISTAYSVTISLPNGCQSSDTILVDIAPEFMADAGNDIVICQNQSQILSAVEIPGATYSWSNGSFNRNIMVSPLVNTSYYLTVTLGDCEDIDTVNVIVQECGNIGDFVWEDLNANGIQDLTELGIPSVLIYLYNENDSLISTIQTDINGYYSFENLYFGNYYLVFNTPLNYQNTYVSQGTNAALDSDVDPVTKRTPLISITSSSSTSEIDAGYYKFVFLGDFVWEDLNQNGLFETNEAGISDALVLVSGLTGTGIPFFTSTLTDSDGKYLFTQIIPGKYVINVSVIDNRYKPTLKNVGINPEIDSNIDSLGNTDTLFVTSGTIDLSIDAGLFKCATVGDFVWLDNGLVSNVQDMEDQGLNGITVYLHNDLIPSTIIDSVVTNSRNGIDGYYSFEVCKEGNYIISVNNGTDYNIVVPDQSSDPELDSDIDQLSKMTKLFFIPFGSDIDTIDIGLILVPLPLIWGQIRADWNKDEKNIDIFWSVSSENNVFQYSIFRSIDGINFIKLDSVKANNSNTLQTYYYSDFDVSDINTRVYYKVMGVDFDGKISWSKVASTNTLNNSTDIGFQIVPNPTSQNFVLELSEQLIKSPFTLKIVSNTGTILSSERFVVEKNSIQMNDINLVPGVYYILISNTTNILSKKLIVIE